MKQSLPIRPDAVTFERDCQVGKWSKLADMNLKSTSCIGFALAFGMLSCSVGQKKEAPGNEARRWAIALHGGAGTISRSQMTPARDSGYRTSLDLALKTGEDILSRGGSALDAVEQTIAVLEDNPLFNAGRGAVFNREGKVQLDAAIMEGEKGMAGAVAAVEGIRNPIRLARIVMERSPHVFLCGAGAREFGIEQGLDTASASWFYTRERWEQLQRQRATGKSGSLENHAESLGTVGCVALDQQGLLAAGTSTGGMTNKREGRIGDSPVIGAGTWADNRTCAVSCTGHGEYFLRLAMAHELHSRILHGNQGLEKAAGALILEELSKAGAQGGLIAVDGKGRIVMPFNSEGMFRAFSNGKSRKIVIYRE